MGSDGGVKMQDSVTVNTKGPFEVRNHTAGPGKFFSGIDQNAHVPATAQPGKRSSVPTRNSGIIART